MATYPYCSNPARAKEFFQEIQGVGVPAKVTTKYLESLGYKSKNDRAIIGVLRALGFIDASGTPSDAWKKYRNKAEAKAVMATAMRSTYKDLFSTFPDAYRRDNEALRNFFSSHTSVGEGGLRFMVGTFKSLAELADFGSDEIDLGDDEPDRLREVDERFATNERGGLDMRRSRSTNGGATGAVVLNLNIQLHVPETDKAEVYDSFFAAMKKHLLS